MANVPDRSPLLEIRHKSQQSHDSGAYIEWNNEESIIIKEESYQSNVTGEFVTVVAVETIEQTETVSETPFVTVVSIGENKSPEIVLPEIEDVLVYRLPGERLGFGLKFEGGLKNAERVSHLFIQSCAPDSPASRTRCSWGPLAAGDEIIEIDEMPVKDMTRIDCVRSLKESNVVIKLKVKPQRNAPRAIDQDQNEEQSSPPPIPPRKVPRRNSALKEAAIVCPPDGFGDDSNKDARTNKSGSPKASIKCIDDLTRNNVPEAEVYVDLIAQESEALMGESESDDTGSSISTVVDRLSSAPTTSNSSFSDVRSIASLDITTPPTPTTTNTCPTFDLDRVLEPFLQLEREFSSSATIDESSLFNKLVAAANFTESSHVVVTRTSSTTSSTAVDDSLALQPPANFQDIPLNRGPLNGETEAIEEELNNTDPPLLLKTHPRKSHNIVLYQTADSVNESEVDENVDEDQENLAEAPALPPKPTPRKDLSQKSKFKSGKKRPPPPPPPCSDRPLCPNPQKENVVDFDKDYPDSSDCQSEMLDHHLPRLIDFVPKDRTDVLVPNVIHPENSQQNHMEMLIQRQRLLELINTKPIDVEVGNGGLIQSAVDVDNASSESSDVEDHCQEILMCEPSLSDDEDSYPVHRSLAHLTTIGEDEEDGNEEIIVSAFEEPNDAIVDTVDAEVQEVLQDVAEDVPDNVFLPVNQHIVAAEEINIIIKDNNTGKPALNFQTEPVLTKVKPYADVNPTPVAKIPLDETPPITSSIETPLANGVDEKTVDNLESGVRGAMDASATATLSLSPPPSFSRLPPDGHEFPPNYQEPCPEPIITSVEMDISLKTVPPPLPTSAPPVPRKKPSVRSSIDSDVESFTSAVRKFSTSSNASSVEEFPVRTPIRGSAWRNDEKSEKSVRDKIAMFSSATDESPVLPSTTPAATTTVRRLNRFKSSEDVFCSDNSSGSFPSGKLFSRSVMSVDKVTTQAYQTDNLQRPRSPMKKSLNYSSMMDVTHALPNNRQVKPNSLDFTSRTQSSMDLTSSSSSSAYSSCSPDSSLTPTISPPYLGYSSTLPRKHNREPERKNSLTTSPTPSLDSKPQAAITRAMSFTSGNKLHSRSQSLIDVYSPSVNKYVPNISVKGNTEDARRASLHALIEQRRRSISKLRGLVIPEKVSETPLPPTITDLPEIKSRESILSSKCPTVIEEPSRRSSFSTYGRVGTNNSSSISANYMNAVSAQNNLNSPLWKSQTPSNDIPKYSPAFKRKSLALYGVPSSASSVSSSLSSSREELRPIFDNGTVVSSVKSSFVPPIPPSKPPRSLNSSSRQNFHSQSMLSPTLHHEHAPKSLESITSPTQSDVSFEFISSNGSSPDVKMMRPDDNSFEDKDNNIKTNYKNNNNEPQVTPVIKLLNKHRLTSDLRRSGGEESDNDSAVSSSRSSISHDFSPPQSPVPDNHQRLGDDDHTSNRAHVLLSPSNSASSGDRRTLRRTLSSETTASAASSTGSTLTSGSQASCSSSSTDSMSRRVLKAQSVEAINRKNVLSSARFSSGQDFKVGSPLIQRKFEEQLLEEQNYCENSNIDSMEDGGTESFIDKLKKSLQKDEISEMTNENYNGEEIVNYQLTSDSEYSISSTKVAYLEMEVVDGGAFSSQEDSSFIDSNPSSMEHLDCDPIPAPREIFTVESRLENSVVDGKNLQNGDNFRENSVKKDHIENFTKEPSNVTISIDDVIPSKPYIKRITRERKVIHEELTMENDNTTKHTVVEENTQENIDYSVSPDVPPKPSQRRSSLISSNKKDSLEIETESDSKQKENALPKESPLPSPVSKIPTASARSVTSRRSVSVNDIRKAFEKAEMVLVGNRAKSAVVNGNGHLIPSHARVSSLDSTTSEDSCAQTPTHYGSITNLQKEQQFGSITSLASSTSLISQQELQQLIEDANQTLEEAGGCSHEVVVVILHRDTAGGSVGITLAGGADYESKEITVHKVLAGSPADRDGRIQKGDRILSINGRSMKGVSHRESLTILKAPRPEVVLVVSRWRPDGYTDTAEDPLVVSLRNTMRPPRIPEQLPEISTDASACDKDENVEDIARGPPVTVNLTKDGAGLGFSLEGGKDSPLGDQPLTIKKIFTGGCAEKSGQLFAGDELLNVNGTDVTTMSRIEAWGLMKRLADGKVVLSVRHKVAN